MAHSVSLAGAALYTRRYSLDCCCGTSGLLLESRSPVPAAPSSQVARRTETR